jgi:hypothetical protein
VREERKKERRKGRKEGREATTTRTDDSGHDQATRRSDDQSDEGRRKSREEKVYWSKVAAMMAIWTTAQKYCGHEGRRFVSGEGWEGDLMHSSEPSQTRTCAVRVLPKTICTNLRVLGHAELVDGLRDEVAIDETEQAGDEGVPNRLGGILALDGRTTQDGPLGSGGFDGNGGVVGTGEVARGFILGKAKGEVVRSGT